MNEYPFFRIGGEMGKLVRAFDWQSSPLGSPDLWPQSLRSTVSIVLGSKFPMLLMWGDALVQIYNDGYREILGDAGKHPKALGQNAADCWPEVWSLIAPSIEALRSGQEGNWNEDSANEIQRNGRIEKIFTTSSLGPVLGESGSVEGVLLVCMDTTTRIQASEESRRNEQRFEAAVKAIQGTVWTNNAEGEMEGKQHGWESLTGQAKDDYQKFGWTHAIHPDDVKKSVDAWNLAVTSRSTYEIEHRILRKTGEWGIFSARAIPVPNADGSIREWVGVHLDITAQRKMENAIVQNEQKLRSFLESTPFPTAVYAGKEMRIEIANQAIIDAWGKGNDVIGKTFIDLLPELEEQQVFTQINTVYTTGIAFHARNTAIDLLKDGKMETGYFNYSFTPVFTPTGEVYGVMNTAADVTDLNLARQNLVASENRLFNLVMKAPVAMCILKGRDHIVEIANERMVELWGKGIDEVGGKALFDALPELSNQEFKALADGVFFSGQSYSALGVPVTLPRDEKQAIVFVNFVFEAYREADSTISGIIVIAVDVTPQILADKQIEEVVATRTEELAEANQQLLRTNEELAQYAFVASHDLQEPLRKIRTFASMLFKGIEIDFGNRELIDKIAGSAERMSLLIQNLLDFSSLAGSSEAFEHVDLKVAVATIAEDYELSIKEKKAVISIGELPKVVASALQMNQLFYNLLGNALKFTIRERPPVISISSRTLNAADAGRYIVKVQPEIEYHEIAVSDNGIGFSSIYGEQIFEPFKRLHTRNAFPGSGIGLALCRRIVDIHGGALYARSAPGSGSTFFVLLPSHHRAAAR